MKYLFLVFAFFYNLSFLNAQQIITTIAGGIGQPGYSGDGGPALNARLNQPVGLALDNAGNLYVADSYNYVIRKIDKTGIITTVAGTGVSGNSGDGGPATSARMGQPYGVAFDRSGNMYILDASNSVVRKVNTSGIITTIAGTPGANGYTGDGGPAVTAKLNAPCAIAIDATGNIYISDGRNIVVRKIDLSGIITTYAGNADGSFAIYGAGGPATSASIGYPVGLAIDNSNNLYIGEDTKPVVWKVNAAGMISIFAGNTTSGYNGDGGPATSAGLGEFLPALACDNSGNTYLADYINCSIRKIDNTGIISTIAGGHGLFYSGDGGPATAAALSNPRGIVVDNTDGSIYITDVFNYTIRKISGCGTQIPTLSIAVSSSTPVCEGSTVGFTATSTEGGTAPSYQWQVNGSNVGANAPTYMAVTPHDGDVISCTLTSNALCLATSQASSNSIKINVLPVVTPAVNITASSVSICANTPATFTASPANGGASPSYQWEINGAPVGSGTMTYTTDALTDGDIVSCIMTGDAACAATPMAFSNGIPMQVTQPPLTSISISASPPAICAGDVASFTAMTSNGGVTPLFQWKVNGNNTGVNSNTFSSSSLPDGDQVSCVLTSSLTCALPVSSNAVPMTVHPVPIVSAGPDTALYWGSSVQLYAYSDGVNLDYNWAPAVGLSNPSIANPIAKPDDSITYFVTVSTAYGCIGTGNAKISLLRRLVMPSAFTPNNDGKNDLFRIPYGVALELKDFSIYDRWGSLVFRTTNIGAGWDGTISGHEAPTGTYVYFIRGTFQGKELDIKGTVMLIR